jgi:hypothetical protein
VKTHEVDVGSNVVQEVTRHGREESGSGEAMENQCDTRRTVRRADRGGDLAQHEPPGGKILLLQRREAEDEEVGPCRGGKEPGKSRVERVRGRDLRLAGFSGNLGVGEVDREARAPSGLPRGGDQNTRRFLGRRVGEGFRGDVEQQAGRVR